MMTFTKWIMDKHLNEDSPIGDLAMDIKRDETWDDSFDTACARFHVGARGSSQVLEVFDEAVDEYVRDFFARY